MIISKEELKNRLDIMSDLGVQDKYKRYLIDSVNDGVCGGFVSLVDELSSKALWLGSASSLDEIKKRMEQHLEARKMVIDKYKECSENVNVQ